MKLNCKASVFGLVLFLAGCGGGGGGGGSSAPQGPDITLQPANTSVYEGDAATFSVAANDYGVVSHQWKKNGAAIAGATSAQYTTAATTLADDQTQYSVEIKGPSGTRSSVPAILSVKQASPFITTAPTPQTVVNGQMAQFSVSADGRPSLSYQWKMNGSAIAGATDSSYRFTATLADDGKQYSVTISNAQGTLTSDAVTLSVVPPPARSELLITEVSSCYLVCWFEIYNPTSSPINLSAYSFRSTSVDIALYTIGSTTFALPNIPLAPDSHVIVSGNYNRLPQRGSQNIRIINGNNIPYWEQSGFVELLKAGATVDFVRFGSSTDVPTSGGWNGSNVAALPNVTQQTETGKSLVRPFPYKTVDKDTDSAADWISVDWVTPGGRNDIGANVLDTDQDGIPDSAEVAGGTYAGMDLYAMGARVGTRDIFIELDHMDSTDAGIVPRQAALQKVVDAFSAQGIKLWIDAGTAFSASFSPANFNLGQGNPKVPYERCVNFGDSTSTLYNCGSNTSSRRTIYDWKADYMELRRMNVFHYALFGSSQKTSGACGSGGVAEVNGNDLIVTLGGCNLSTANITYPHLATNYQASTLMHELGHNLGLRHGGNENTNYKPNYWSVMNYLYAYGLDPDPTASTAYERWNFFANAPSTATLADLCGTWLTVATPCGDPTNFVINYSNGSSADLNENTLYEADNVGRGRRNGTAYADWDLSHALNSSALSIDLNKTGTKEILKDYDDWRYLILPFARVDQDYEGLALFSRPRPTRLNPIADDQQAIAVEEPIWPRMMGH